MLFAKKNHSFDWRANQWPLCGKIMFSFIPLQATIYCQFSWKAKWFLTYPPLPIYDCLQPPWWCPVLVQAGLRDQGFFSVYPVKLTQAFARFFEFLRFQIEFSRFQTEFSRFLSENACIMSFSYLVLWFEAKLLSMHNYRGAVPIEIRNVVAFSIEGHLIACKKKQKLMHKLAF